MCQVLVDIPNEVLYDTHMSTSDASAFVKQMVALGYYTHNNVSIGYCAKISRPSFDRNCWCIAPSESERSCSQGYAHRG